MKILIFPRYSTQQASTRVRFSQFVPALQQVGFEVELFPIVHNASVGGVQRHAAGRLSQMGSRLRSCFNVYKKLRQAQPSDWVHVYIEFFPWLPYVIEKALLRLSGRNRFSIEIDDAWFHRYDNHRFALIRWLLGDKIDKLMRDASCVIAGNIYIAQRAYAAGAHRVEIVPTVVDTDRYTDAKPQKTSKKGQTQGSLPTIGWIGSASTTPFLVSLEPIITYLHMHKKAVFKAMGAHPWLLRDIPISLVPWSAEDEMAFLYSLDIGIMPLTDTLFERGKCGYKLIQYMACGLPVVGSPVGVNSEIVLHGDNGFLAQKDEEWVIYLKLLCESPSMRDEMGRLGLQHATVHYSLNAWAPKIVAIFKSLAIN